MLKYSAFMVWYINTNNFEVLQLLVLPRVYSIHSRMFYITNKALIYIV